MPEQAYYQQYKPMSQKSYESFPLTHQVAKFLTASTLSTILLVLSGLTMTGTVIALIVAAPVLVLFSPVLVPAAIIAFLVALGFVFSGGCGVAALSAASWVYSYIAGKHPPGADQLDYAREKLASTARGMTDKAKEYGQHGRERIHEGTRAA